MEKQFALEKQRELKISPDRIVREEYEMILLNEIFESEFGAHLVFRGGTALRLAYGSPRFSDDLDFTQLKELEEGVFKTWCVEVAKKTNNVELDEALQKYYTLYARFRITDPAITRAFGIKVEISRRAGAWEKDKDYELKQLSSDVTPVTVFAQVATLEKIENEKKSIKDVRIRDIFDLWFIGQKLGTNTPMDFKGFSAKAVQQDLHRLLPERKYELLKQWLA